MKFSQMPYARPDLAAFRSLTEKTVARLKEAGSAHEQIEAYRAYEKASNTIETMAAIITIRHTIDAKDSFYAGEQDWLDESMPQIEELSQLVNQALLDSPFRAELAAELGEVLFTNLEIAVRGFKPELMELMME